MPGVINLSAMNQGTQHKKCFNSIPSHCLKWIYPILRDALWRHPSASQIRTVVWCEERHKCVGLYQWWSPLTNGIVNEKAAFKAVR
jgi:hypothetical protein